MASLEKQLNDLLRVNKDQAEGLWNLSESLVDAHDLLREVEGFFANGHEDDGMDLWRRISDHLKAHVSDEAVAKREFHPGECDTGCGCEVPAQDVCARCGHPDCRRFTADDIKFIEDCQKLPAQTQDVQAKREFHPGECDASCGCEVDAHNAAANVPMTDTRLKYLADQNAQAQQTTVTHTRDCYKISDNWICTRDCPLARTQNVHTFQDSVEETRRVSERARAERYAASLPCDDCCRNTSHRSGCERDPDPAWSQQVQAEPKRPDTVNGAPVPETGEE